MRTCQVYNPNEVVTTVLDFKNWAYQVNHTAPPAFSHTKDPVIHIDGFWIKGLKALIEYLDRRLPFPLLIPASAENAATALMAVDEILDGSFDPSPWVEWLSTQSFVLGNSPCLADLLLAVRFGHLEELQPYARRVLAWRDKYEA